MLNDFENFDFMPEPEYSDRHKRKMNRIFREVAHCAKIPYPEADNFFERFRSNVIVYMSKFLKGVR